MAIKFEDATEKVKEKLYDTMVKWMYDSAGELQSQTIKNSRKDTGQTRGSYQYRVIEKDDRVDGYIGSNAENAIWEEYGTGEYALKGNGRKTPWVYKNRKGEFYWTTGKTPHRPMRRAYNEKIEMLIRQLAKDLSETFR